MATQILNQPVGTSYGGLDYLNEVLYKNRVLNLQYQAEENRTTLQKRELEAKKDYYATIEKQNELANTLAQNRYQLELIRTMGVGGEIPGVNLNDNTPKENYNAAVSFFEGKVPEGFVPVAASHALGNLQKLYMKEKQLKNQNEMFEHQMDAMEADKRLKANQAINSAFMNYKTTGGKVLEDGKPTEAFMDWAESMGEEYNRPLEEIFRLTGIPSETYEKAQDEAERQEDIETHLKKPSREIPYPVESLISSVSDILPKFDRLQTLWNDYNTSGRVNTIGHEEGTSKEVETYEQMMKSPDFGNFVTEAPDDIIPESTRKLYILGRENPDGSVRAKIGDYTFRYSPNQQKVLKKDPYLYLVSLASREEKGFWEGSKRYVHIHGLLRALKPIFDKGITHPGKITDIFNLIRESDTLSLDESTIEKYENFIYDLIDEGYLNGQE
jgi:hypothetical protein